MLNIKNLDLGNYPHSQIKNDMMEQGDYHKKELTEILGENIKFKKLYTNIKSSREQTGTNNKELNKLDKDKNADINDEIQKKLETLGISRSIRKKVYFAILELTDNIVNYAPGIKNELEINIKDNKITIITRNMIQKNSEHEQKLKKSIEELNKLSNEELKERYKKTLNNKKFNKQGGAGLGLIQMARQARSAFGKNDDKIGVYSINFKKIDDDDIQNNEQTANNYDIVEIKLEMPLQKAA